MAKRGPKPKPVAHIWDQRGIRLLMRERYVDSERCLEFRCRRWWLAGVRADHIWAMVEQGAVVFRTLRMSRIRVMRSAPVRYRREGEPWFEEQDEEILHRTSRASGWERQSAYGDPIQKCDVCGRWTLIFRQGMCRRCWVRERRRFAETGESAWFCWYREDIWRRDKAPIGDEG